MTQLYINNLYTNRRRIYAQILPFVKMRSTMRTATYFKSISESQI